MTFPNASARRIIATILVSLVFSGLAVIAGLWQYGRYEARADARDLQERAAGLAPVPVSSLAPADDLPADAVWRLVIATGVFDPASVVVLRNRPVDGTAAWHYLAWLDTEDERSFLVSVGWIPQPGPLDDPATPDITDETVTVTAVMREFEGDDGRRGDGSVTRIDPAQMPEPSNPPVPGYGMMREVCDTTDCAPTLVGDQVPAPQLTLGPHLAYAWQWWVFAAMAPVGAVLLIRRERDEERAERGETPVRDTPKRRRRTPSDEEIEDAL